MRTKFSLLFAFLSSISCIAQVNDIFEATKEGDLDAVKAIVATNSSALNVLDENGQTPLFLAVELEQTNVAIFLLSQGADPTITNKNGVSSILMAKVLGDGAVLGLDKFKEVNVHPEKDCTNILIATKQKRITSVTFTDGSQLTGIVYVSAYRGGRIFLTLTNTGYFHNSTDFSNDGFLESWGISYSNVTNEWEKMRAQTQDQTQEHSDSLLAVSGQVPNVANSSSLISYDKTTGYIEPTEADLASLISLMQSSLNSITTLYGDDGSRPSFDGYYQICDQYTRIMNPFFASWPPDERDFYLTKATQIIINRFGLSRP